MNSLLGCAKFTYLTGGKKKRTVEKMLVLLPLGPSLSSRWVRDLRQPLPQPNVADTLVSPGPKLPLNFEESLLKERKAMAFWFWKVRLRHKVKGPTNPVPYTTVCTP